MSHLFYMISNLFHHSENFWLKLRNFVPLILIALIPIFFLPFTTDLLEINKQTLLVFGVLVAMILWVGGVIHQKTLIFRKNSSVLLAFIFFLSIIISAISNHVGLRGWIGDGGQAYVSILGSFSFILFFLLLIERQNEVRSSRPLNIFLASSILAGLLAILHSVGLPILTFIPGISETFNTVGTITAAAILVFIATATSIGRGLVTINESIGAKISTFILSIFSLIFLILLDDFVVSILMVVGIGIMFMFAVAAPNKMADTSKFALPMILFVVSLLLLFLPSPIERKVPLEIYPSQKASLQIAEQTLQNQSLLFGSGPGTYIFDYTKYKDLSVNQTSLWDTKFDRGASHFLTLLTTTGLIGMLTFLGLIVFIAFPTIRILTKKHEDRFWNQTFIIFSGWSTAVAAMLFYSSNLTLQFTFWLLSALLVSNLELREHKIIFSQSPRSKLVFSFFFVLLSVGLVTGVFITAERYAAEFSFTQAVKANVSGESVDDVITYLDKASRFNRWSDVYFRNLSEAYLTKLKNNISKEELSDSDIAEIQNLLSAAFASAQASVQLEPMNVANWTIRGSLYRESLAIVDKAENVALQSFEIAKSLEPNNPKHEAEIGKTYLALAQKIKEISGPNEETDAYLQSAQEAFEKAIDLKEDYAPAYYYLGIVFETKGDLDEAITKMESVQKYNPLDVGVAFELGILYLRQGKNDLAQAELEQAVILSPLYSNARWFLASVYEQQGDIEKAIEQIEIVQKLNPDNQLVATKLDRLKAGQVSEEIPEPVEAAE